MSNIENLNGRRVIWAICEEYMAKRPFLGYGFGAGGRIAASRVGLATAHSSYYEAAMGVGMVGVVLLALQVLMVSIRTAGNIRRKGLHALCFEIMFFCHLIPIAYTSILIGGWSSPAYVIWLFFFFLGTGCNGNGTFQERFLRGMLECAGKLTMVSVYRY